MLTMGVVKNIIPAVASTNAIIAAACVNEVLKVLSWGSQTLNTYFMYNGTTGVYSHTFEYAKKEGCPVCNPATQIVTANAEDTLQTLIDALVKDPALQLAKPSLAKPGVSLFMQNPAALREATAPNLEKKLKDLLKDGDEITVTDPVFPLGTALDVRIRFA
jgi:ubiquitin-activating enzyme E1 C